MCFLKKFLCLKFKEKVKLLIIYRLKINGLIFHKCKKMKKKITVNDCRHPKDDAQHDGNQNMDVAIVCMNEHSQRLKFEPNNFKKEIFLIIFSNFQEMK